MRCSLALALLAGCQDYALEKENVGGVGATPIIEVEPTRLDFWEVGGDETEVLAFTVRNVGDGELIVSELVPPETGDFTLLRDAASFTLAPGESTEVEVAFAPTTPGDHAGTVLVRSNDADAPEVPVELAGGGRMPWLVVDPASHDFGAVPIPCGEELELVLQNVGDEDLDVSGVAMSGDAQMTLTDDAGGVFTLPPGAYTTVTVALSAATPGDAAASLDVTSNDPRGVVSAPLTAAPEHAGDREDVFAVDDAPPVDIVFAVDQSGSMDDDAVSLGENFAAFVAEVGARTSGWQVGVVTYDDGCANGGVLTAASADLTTTFSDAVGLGADTEISDDEALFQIVDRALQQTGAGGCNEGLRRDGALLHVIVVSDEPERSPEQASAWTWDWFVGSWQAWVGSPSLLRVSGVVDTDGCGEGAEGYAEAIAATGGEALSICSGDWAAHVAALAEASTAGLWSFPLTETPDPGTIEVAVDGVAVTSGWTYDAAGNAVVFAAPPEGQQVVVTYGVAAACP